MRVWCLAVCLLVAGCEETFEDPPKLDLYKPPYDFGPGRGPPGAELGVALDAGMPDMPEAMPDLTPEPDLTPAPDLTMMPDQG